MIDPERYLNPDGSYDWEKFDQLTEDERTDIMVRWNASLWFDYYDRFGWMTVDEFEEMLMNIIEEELDPNKQLNTDDNGRSEKILKLRRLV
jgi:hypothetical protein